MKTGKLPPILFKEILDLIKGSAEGVEVPPLYGVDAGAFKIADKYIVVAQDPITFTSSDIIWYSVYVNANDVAVLGAKPEYFLLTLLLPENILEDEIKELFKRLNEVCNQLGVKILGGHTEVTYGIDRVIVNGTMIGITDKIITSQDAKPGDYLVMIKGIPIEAISIVAREKEQELLRYLPPKEIKRLKNFNYNPGISIVREALVLKDYVNAMHDITEGGLMGAVFEMANSSNVKIIIEKEDVKVYPEAKVLEYFDIDPYFAIGSGSLIASVSEDNLDNLLKRCKKERVDISIIGQITEGSGVWVKEGNKISKLEWEGQDSIVKLFE